MARDAHGYAFMSILKKLAVTATAAALAAFALKGNKKSVEKTAKSAVKTAKSTATKAKSKSKGAARKAKAKAKAVAQQA